MPGASHGQDVRLQEAGEEEDQKEERGIHGTQREADSGEGQQSVCSKYSPPLKVGSTYCRHASACTLALDHPRWDRELRLTSVSISPPGGEPGVRLRDEGCPLPGADTHEWRRPEVPHLSHGRGRIRGEEGCLLFR